MTTLLDYVKHRHFSKSHGFGRPLVRWLWLDAALYGFRRWSTLHSPWFAAWCGEVDRLFVEQFKWERSMTRDTGLDSWIDSYWCGMAPQEAVDSEVAHWEE